MSFLSSEPRKVTLFVAEKVKKDVVVASKDLVFGHVKLQNKEMLDEILGSQKQKT